MFRIQITGVSFSNHWCFEFEPVVFDNGSADGIAFVIQGGQLLTVVGGTTDFHFLLRTDDDRVSFRFQLVDIIQHFVIVAVAQLQLLPDSGIPTIDEAGQPEILSSSGSLCYGSG